MRVVGHLVDAVRTTCVIRWTKTETAFARAEPRTHCIFIDRTIAVVVLAVAFVRRVRIRIGVTIVAIFSAADDRRLPVVVFVEGRVVANGRSLIAMDVVLARDGAESVYA